MRILLSALTMFSFLTVSATNFSPAFAQTAKPAETKTEKKVEDTKAKTAAPATQTPAKKDEVKK
jgi:hypothetical protein